MSSSGHLLRYRFLTFSIFLDLSGYFAFRSFALDSTTSRHPSLPWNTVCCTNFLVNSSLHALVLRPRETLSSHSVWAISLRQLRTSPSNWSSRTLIIFTQVVECNGTRNKLKCASEVSWRDAHAYEFSHLFRGIITEFQNLTQMLLDINQLGDIWCVRMPWPTFAHLNAKITEFPLIIRESWNCRNETIIFSVYHKPRWSSAVVCSTIQAEYQQ